MEEIIIKMYKLITIDIDGTLLNSCGEITEKNKEAIKKAFNFRKSSNGNYANSK